MKIDKQKFLKTVSKNIKKYRAQNGLTQEKFAEKAERNLPFCAAIETGRKVPSAFALRNMADKSAAYAEFIGRLIAVCNDFNDAK